ncbi:MAG: ParA family protein [Actinomycetota bacterium]|nr:ParA family protein [Actinomycetota bacterium]
MRVVAAYNIKGGVGKTSAAVNLAHLAAGDGFRTLLWDLDPQGAASFLFRIKPKVKGGGKAIVRRDRPLGRAVKATDFDGLDLIPADFSYRNMDLDLDDQKKPIGRLRRLLAPMADEYDVVFLDCPPSISLVSESVMDAADLLLVPLIPATLSLRTFDQLGTFLDGFDGRRPELLAFFSMVDRRKRLHRDVMEHLSPAHGRVAAAAIPALSAIERMAEARTPVTAAAPGSRAGMAYRSLWAEVLATMCRLESCP